ncbi:unnamed protein product [Didymodactylos carnosus]|uniref:Peptidase A1 domain-containing protein n=1 Tax=Didymodactylos carnosus TaxID=1234261 RepID=A0A814S818_9BILA|nr:unnamed protein product [Didymodactylos carnosus]CAF3907513.1 unnamed protein product [Didymodactylos carnosus]
MVNVAGKNLAGQLFAEMTSGAGFDDNLSDGLLGLAYPASGGNGETPLFFNMYKQGLIPQPIFSFYLHPLAQPGKLKFGGADTTEYIAPITYTPVIEKYYWKFSVNSVNVLNTNICSSGCYAIADTGNTYIGDPSSYISKLNKLIGGTYNDSIGS